MLSIALGARLDIAERIAVVDEGHGGNENQHGGADENEGYNISGHLKTFLARLWLEGSPERWWAAYSILERRYWDAMAINPLSHFPPMLVQGLYRLCFVRAAPFIKNWAMLYCIM